MITLDLNDAGLLAARKSDGTLLSLEDGAFASPGAALAAPEGLMTGLAAWRQARLHPTRVILDAWDRMDTKPLHRSEAGLRHAADVALTHARQLQTRIGLADQPVMLVVPAHYSRDQLAVLLGIAQTLRLRLAGLVDAGCAILTRPPETELALFLDLQLNRTTATLYAHREGSLRRLGAVTTDKAGLWMLTLSLLKSISRQFVLQTRYDPSHEAAGEQALFNQLPDFLRRLSGVEAAEIHLSQGGHSHRAAVKASALVQATAPFAHECLSTIQVLLHQHGAAGKPLQIFGGHRLQHVPGISASLHTLGDVSVAWVPEGAAAIGALSLPEAATADGARLVTTRSYAPVAAPQGTANVRTGSRTDEARPTHLLLGDVAHPVNGITWHLSFRPTEGSVTISREPLETGVSLRGDGEGVLLHCRDSRARLNGRPTSGVEDVGIGDRIGFEGCKEEARLIRAIAGA